MKYIKRVAVMVTILLSAIGAIGQFKEIAAAPAFKEPEDGIGKMLLLKNGGVIFFSVLLKGSIEVRVYNPAHQETVVTNIEPANGKLKSGGLCGAFEINGDAVLMISDLEEKTPVLYRLVIDGTTGRLKNEAKVAEMRKLKMGFGRAMSYGNEDVPNFYTDKDPYSDNYAVAFYYSSESGEAKIVNIVCFGSDHKEQSRGSVQFSDNPQNFLWFRNICVNGPDNVNVLFGHSIVPPKDPKAGPFSKAADRQNKMHIAYIEKGTSNIILNDLELPLDSTIRETNLQYDPHSRKFVLSGEISKSLYEPKSTFLAWIDPGTRQIERRHNILLSPAINEAATPIFGKKYQFWGSPDEVIITDKGFTVVYEEQAFLSNSSEHQTVYRYELSNVVIAHYDRSGALIDNFLIIKSALQTVSGSIQYAKGFGNHFRTIYFLAGKEKEYLLYNDTRRNIERLAENKKPIQVFKTIDCDAFYFPIAGKNIIPERKYMFGESDEKKERNMVALGLSLYDKANDLLITFRRSTDPRNSDLTLVWLKPQ